MNVNIRFKYLKGFKIMNLNQLISLEGSEFIEDNNQININDEDYGACNLILKIPKLSSVVVILQIIDLPWLCTIDWFHDIWFDYPVEVMIRKLRKEDNSDRIEMDSKGLYLYEIEHDRGVIIFIENLTSFIYRINFNITKIKNLQLKPLEEIKISDEGKSLEFMVKSKEIIILNFGIIESIKEKNTYKLRYVYNVDEY